MIQWRNLNIDPDVYCEVIELRKDEEAIGLRPLIDDLGRRYPDLRHGYVNPPKESWDLETRLSRQHPREAGVAFDRRNCNQDLT